MRFLFILFCLMFLSSCDGLSSNLFEADGEWLDRAIRNNDISAVMAIIDKSSSDVNRVIGARYEERPIHVAAYYGRDEIIKYLAMKGADLNALNKGGKRTALLTAIWKNHESTALLLLSLGADSSIKTSSGLSACTVANRAMARGAQLLAVIHALPNCTIQVPSDCK